MSTSARSYRVRLSSIPDEPRSERWPAIAKFGLSLDDDEVDRLAQALPQELVLAPTEPAQLERLTSNLRGCGVEVFPEPMVVRYDSCERHVRLAKSESCPSCKGRACGACLRLREEALCPRCAKKKERKKIFRQARISVLLVVLLVVAWSAHASKKKVTSWKQTLVVGIYPMAAVTDPATQAYIAGLTPSAFEEIEQFLGKEGHRHGLATSPLVNVELGPAVSELPPAPPRDSVSWVDIMFWSLELRFWAYRMGAKHKFAPADVRIFVVYHAPEKGKVLEHSVGLEKGHLGVVHAFAEDRSAPRNNVVIAHELLHAAGATDKYDEEGLPNFPDGYADPEQRPRFPQARAELMGGRVPLSETRAEMPTGLSECVIGPLTAREIGWVSGRP